MFIPFVGKIGGNGSEDYQLFCGRDAAELLAPAITQGMHRCVDIGCFGYAPPEKERYDKAVVQWMKQRHSWDVDMSQCTQTTGVVTAMGIAIRALTQPGDGVIVQTPVYTSPNSIKNNGRTLIENPLEM